jgi:hypothetical protein
MTKIERRVLAHLDQQGGAVHRRAVVESLADENSRIGRGVLNGSNSAIPLIMGAWCKRLIRLGLVREARCPRGFYLAHAITNRGRKELRNLSE